MNKFNDRSGEMSKKDLLEEDIYLRDITPAHESAAWDKMKQNAR